MSVQTTTRSLLRYLLFFRRFLWDSIRFPAPQVLLLSIVGYNVSLAAENPFRVATYNVENYLLESTDSRPIKSPAARDAVHRSLVALQADVVGLQEIGGSNALESLRVSLRSLGLAYPHSSLAMGFDTNIQIALLSRFPIRRQELHVTDSFLFQGRRFRSLRGFIEADIQLPSGYTFTIFVAHLKSRRVSTEADQAEIRLHEARLLREKIEQRLRNRPDLNLIVLGDFNDVQDSRSLRALLGRGRLKLVDTRPGERGTTGTTGEDSTSSDLTSRSITWTHFYAKEDTYSRCDYILLSPGMVEEWLPRNGYVLNLPGWGSASDHRPVVAGFQAGR